MRKADLDNMVIRLGNAIKLKKSSRTLLICIAWRANSAGRLRTRNNRKISFTSCGKDGDIYDNTLTRSLDELEKKGLIYREEHGSGGLILEKIQHLYEKRKAQWITEDNDEAPSEIEGNLQNGGASPSKMAGEHPPKWGDNYNGTTGHPPQRAEHADSSVNEVSLMMCQQFIARYPKRDYLDEGKVWQAWVAALGRGWRDEGLMEALARAMGRWQSQANPREPDAHEFLQEMQLRKYAPELAPAHRAEDADFYQKVEAYAAEASAKRRPSRASKAAGPEVRAIDNDIPNIPTEFA